MKDLFDDMSAMHKSLNVLARFGINHKDGAICPFEASAVISHLETLLNEQQSILKDAIACDLNDLDEEKLAEWQGTAEGLLDYSKYILNKPNTKENKDEIKSKGNVVSLSEWSAGKTEEKTIKKAHNYFSLAKAK